ncbi:MAG: phosphoadenylyl-sulfate reductase [Pseudomonadota bacterium]
MNDIVPSQKSPAELTRRAETLDGALAQEGDVVARLRILAKVIPGRLAFSTSLGLEDQALLHALSDSGIDVDVFTLDTGRHFPETLDTLDRSALRYKRKVGPIRVVFPDAAETEALVARDGILGFRGSIEARKACCNVRKVQPLNKALAGASAWLTGLRREQSAGRGSVPFAEYDAGLDLVKVNPLADWSLDWLEAYIAEHSVPVNELHSQGYPSIGCQPCTRAIEPGEDIRAGRWWWENEDGKECGLHAPESAKSTAPNAPVITTNGRKAEKEGAGA